MAVKWTHSQQKVIDARNRNLLVSAAAGSGKTAVLVERIIQMISQGEHPISIDQLLIMTFTNAAAAEMRERIGAAVEERLKAHPQDEHLWLQAALVPQAQITTIDSFCLNVIRDHYDKLDIDPGFRIGDEGELSLLKGDVMGQMLEECYEEGEEEFGRFVEHFGQGRSDRGIEDVILQTWQFSQSHPWPDIWLKECEKELEQEAKGELADSRWMKFLLQDVSQQMKELGDQLWEALKVCAEEDGPGAYEPMLLKDIELLSSLRKGAEEGFDSLYAALFNVSFGRLAAVRGKEVSQEKKEFVSLCRDRVKKAVAKCKERYASQSPKEMAESLKGTRQTIQMLLKLTGRFDKCYREAKKERNILDFNDLEHLALEVLLEPMEGEKQEESCKNLFGGRKPSAAADQFSRQFEEILVDEYQDSNSVQEALIASISRERFQAPNVFMVGDVKQSIYRFRLAKPELFMEKYESYSREEGPYQMIELQQNFRSRDTVLSFINDVFYQIMTKNLGGIRYTQETALYPGALYPEKEDDLSREKAVPELLLIDTGEEVLRYLDEEELDYTSKELEARAIAKRIKELTDENSGLLVWDKELGKQKEGGYRRARYGDIVILLRSMSGWSEVFVNVLMNQGIPAHAQTRTGYFNTVEVETVLSLLSVLDNPMQDIPLAAVLRSPVIGMGDEEMAWLLASYKKQTKKGQDRGVYAAWKLWEEAEEGECAKGGPLSMVPLSVAASIREKLQKLKTLTSSLRSQSRYLPVHELLYQVYRESGYYDFVSAMPAGNVRRANLDMLVEKAQAYEATSYQGLFHFIRYIEKLRKFDTDFGEASAFGERENAVRIMSIHKSKGLEFPIVFLAGMGKRFNRQDVNGALLLDADMGVASDFLDLELRVKAPTLKKQALKRRMELEAMGEELRVLYVAMTRAKEKLIMTGTDKSLKNKLEKWRELPLIQGCLPFTVLSGASSFLDWMLMAMPAVCASHLSVEMEDIKTLAGHEVVRQMGRKLAKEDLLDLDENQVWDEEIRKEIGQALGYQYPFEEDTGLYAMASVSELKKQSQIEWARDFSGTEHGELEGAGRELFSWLSPRHETQKGKEENGEKNKGALRGTAYHGVLEHLSFWEIHSLAETEQALLALLEAGYLDQEAYEWVDSEQIWAFLSSPLGKRMALAQKEGKLCKEQQFIIGIPAREMGKSSSEELVLIQGIIDAYLEEEDGLVLIDYKTDRVWEKDKAKGANLLRERYKIQLDYYERALTQLTGKRVKEKLIYSLDLQESIEV